MNKINKSEFILNLIICIYFVILMFLCSLYGFIESYYSASSCEAGGCSGLFIFVVLIVSVLLGFPSIIGLIISIINIFVGKKILTILEIIPVIINIILIFSNLFVSGHYIVFKNIVVVLNVILIILCLVSLFIMFYNAKKEREIQKNM